MSWCPVTLFVERVTCLSSSNDEEEVEFSRRYEQRSYQPAEYLVRLVEAAEVDLDEMFRNVQIGYPNRVSTTQVDVSGHVLSMGNAVGDNIY